MTTPRLTVDVRGKGRHYRHPEHPDDETLYVPSVTNILGVLDKPALVSWAAREVAGAAWDARHSLVKVPERDIAVDMLKGSPYKRRGKAADLGTAVHAVAEALAGDADLPGYPAEASPYVDAFLEFVSAHRVEFVRLESSHYSYENSYAGTADWVAVIDGSRVLGDTKTGKGVYPEVSLQLTALRWAELRAEGDRLVDNEAVDATVVLHLRDDGYSLHEVRSDAPTFQAFLAARSLWSWWKGGGSDGCIGPAAEPVREGVA